MFVLDDLFINFCVLNTGIFFIYHYLRKYKVLKKSSIKSGLILGTINGIFGVILIHFGIYFDDGMLIDLGVIPMIISAQMGGILTTSITTIIIIISRLVFLPISFSSLINIGVLVLSALVFSFITRTKMDAERKWLWMTTSFIIVLSFSLCIIESNVSKFIFAFVLYTLDIGCGAASAHFITSYLLKMYANIEQLKEYAQKDGLTGLNNTRNFNNFLDEAFINTKKRQEDLSLILMDIDYFKNINDTYGHPSGDKVLKEIGKLLSLNCRSIDFISRNGGEEFSVIMPCCNEVSAAKVAERIRDSVETHIFELQNDIKLHLTVSVGFATKNHFNNVSPQELIKQADDALYKAKNTGRNKICSFENKNRNLMSNHA